MKYQLKSKSSKPKVNDQTECDCEQESVGEKEVQEEVLPPDANIVSLIGPLEDRQTTQLITQLTLLNEVVEPDEEVIFNICTPGGDAYGMFGIYDLMRSLREKCIIRTYGLGSVMSAGVLLLSAGTKGHRYIGKHTQLMMHTVSGQSLGHVQQMRAEFMQMEYMTKIYTEALATESGQPIRKIKSILGKKNDVFLGAEKALALGLVDNIF